MALLELQEIHTYYGQVHVLKGVSLCVERGEVVALLGANGAGKSTTLRTISGLVRPRQGRILFRDRPIDQMPAHDIVAEGLVHVPEGRRIFGALTVAENLELGAFRARGQQRIRQRLERVYALFPRLAERRTQWAGTLSGGEQQMLAIGRALMSEPALLMLDEPSMGLAPIMTASIMELIRGIKEEGTTIFLVEQNARAALRLANRAYVLETGEIVLSDTAEKLATNQAIVKAYLGESRKAGG